MKLKFLFLFSFLIQNFSKTNVNYQTNMPIFSFQAFGYFPDKKLIENDLNKVNLKAFQILPESLAVYRIKSNNKKRTKAKR